MNTANEIIKLSDDITKYKYIDIYVNSSGNLAIQTFDSARDYFLCKMFNISDNLTGTFLLVEEISFLKTNNITLTLASSSCIEWVWSGKLNEAPYKQSSDVTGNVFVYKIVGRN